MVIRIERVNVYNWHEANRGMRHSMLSYDKIDSYYEVPPLAEVNRSTGRLEGERWVYGPNDYERALSLAKAGSSHRKFLRQIMVSIELTASGEFFREWDTYKVGTVANSTSAMHKLGSRLLTEDDYSFDKPLSPRARKTIDEFNECIKTWWISGKKVGSPEWRDMVKAMPSGFNYTRTCTLNYEVLRTMYHDRRNHRLQEWRDFCAWIETLPYSELITTTR